VATESTFEHAPD